MRKIFKQDCVIWTQYALKIYQLNKEVLDFFFFFNQINCHYILLSVV